MHRFGMIAAAAAALVVTSAQGATLIPVPPVPGATDTYVFDISDNNTIAGGYVSEDAVEHGFFGSLQGNYTTFDFPSGGGTEARAIDNAGRITGISHFSGRYKYCTYIEFERGEDGTIAAVQRGAVLLHGIVQGFTVKGKFVGDYCHRHHVDGYSGQNDKYMGDVAIAVSTSGTYLRDTNASGEIVGEFLNSEGLYSAFLLKNGVTNVIDYPNPKAANTVLQGLNDGGIATGHWDRGDFQWHAFALDTKTNMFTAIAVPHASYVQAFGINKAGLVAVDASNGPYIYCPSGASCPAGGAMAAEHRVRVSPGSFLHFEAGQTGHGGSRIVAPRSGHANADGIH